MLGWQRATQALGVRWREKTLPRAARVSYAIPQVREGIALTFDDGPDSRFTPELLDILAGAGAVATFFLVGRRAVKQPLIVRRMLDEGHVVGSHTWSHRDPRTASAWELLQEYRDGRRAIEDIVGKEVPLFRPPMGHIGLTRRLTAAGREVVAFDIADPHNGHRMDVTDSQSIAAAIEGCSGIVHLAAVSRVVWGERDPALCRKVNVRGTRNILAAVARNRSHNPWVLVASSREVYGQATEFPVRETAPLRPLNVYARSKVDVEHMVASSRRQGVRASAIRFSSVYGSVTDHADRVAPAFVRLAVAGETLHVDGAGTTLDFTHVEDVAAALHTAIELISAGGGPLPPLHLVSGRGITLPELAELAIKAAGEGVVEVGPPRSYDVSTFIGDPARAEQILGWRASIGIEEGIYRLAECFRAADYSGHAGEELLPAGCEDLMIKSDGSRRPVPVPVVATPRSHCS